MSIVTVGEGRWRMLRKIELSKPQPAKWNLFRDWRRNDAQVLDELLILGLVEAVTGRPECYRITPKGEEVARFGEIDHLELEALKREAVEIVGGVAATLPKAKPGPRGVRLAGTR